MPATSHEMRRRIKRDAGPSPAACRGVGQHEKTVEEGRKSEGIAFANETIMRQLIEVIDNLERAIEHGEKTTIVRPSDGVKMTFKAFIDIFARFGASPFESVGQSFDPNRHEAVFQEPVPNTRI